MLLDECIKIAYAVFENLLLNFKQLLKTPEKSFMDCEMTLVEESAK